MPAAASRDHSTTTRTVVLGLTQTLAWASSVYLPAILAAPVATELGLAGSALFAAYSLALLVMAALGPAVGRAIDRHGGRPVLCLSNLVFAVALLGLGIADSLVMMVAAWLAIGAAMALGLYDAAFAALVRHHGVQARGPITGITLLGGFASTIGWPLSAWLTAEFGWRPACFVWAAAHLFIGLPLNWRFLAGPGADPAAPRSGQAPRAEAPPPTPCRGRNLALLTVFGAATAFVTSAMTTHLPGLLMLGGLGAGTAIAAAALFGPAQVATRLLEFLVLQRLPLHPLWTARAASLLHPLGAVALLLGGGAPAAVAFALCHGSGNGLITIAKGTLPLALFGPAGYGLRQGQLAVSQRLMQAAAPFAFAMVMSAGGAPVALALSAGLSLLALAALLAIRVEP